MLLYLSATGDLLARSFRRLYGRLCGTTPKKVQCPCSNTVRVPVTLCLIIVLAYICSGAVLFHRLENWSLLEGNFYFKIHQRYCQIIHFIALTCFRVLYQTIYLSKKLATTIDNFRRKKRWTSQDSLYYHV